MQFDFLRTFLTYPKSDFTHQDLHEFIQTLSPIKWARVCTEKHSSGEPHVHAVIEFSKRFRSRDQRVFDFRGRHPNVQPVRSVYKSLEYISKDGLFTDFGSIPTKSEKRDWSSIIDASKGPEMDWLQVVHEEKIQQHVAKRIRELAVSCHVDLDEYDQRPISECLQQIPKEYQSLCIVGKPGIGKTGWAMQNSPRPSLCVKHLDMLSKFRPGYHNSIVFDDCDFKHLPRSTQLQIADYENQCQIHIRYSVAIIPKNVPRLFLCNYNSEPFIQDEAIQNRRVKYIYL